MPAYLARCDITSQTNGWFHVIIHVYGDTLAEAKELTETMTTVVGYGCTKHIRTPPEAKTERDFSTKKTAHKGYARFAYRAEPGETATMDVSNEQIRFVPAHATSKEHA